MASTKKKSEEMNHNQYHAEGDVKRRSRTLSEESTTSFSSDEDREGSIRDNNEYDWQREKQRKIQFFDDGTMTYFW